MPKLIPVNLELSYLVDGDRYMAEIEYDCKTGIFSTTAGIRYFRADDGKVYRLDMINQLWKICPQSGEYGTTLHNPVMPNYLPPDVKPIDYPHPMTDIHVIIKNDNNNTWDNNKTFGSILNGRGHFEINPHPEHPSIGRTISIYLPTDNNKYLATDLQNPNCIIMRRWFNQDWGSIETIPTPGDNRVFRVAKTSYYGTPDTVDSMALQYIRNTEKNILNKSIKMSIQILLIDKGIKFVSILDNSCFFRIEPYKFIPAMDYRYPTGPTIDLLVGKNITLYLPTNDNCQLTNLDTPHLKYSLRSKNKILLGSNLNPRWGMPRPLCVKESSPFPSKIYRARDVAFFGMPDNIDADITEYLCSIEQFLRSAEPKRQVAFTF